MYLRLRPPDSEVSSCVTRLVLSVILVTNTLSGEVRTDTVFSEARVSNRRILTLSDSPYFIENDVLVEDTGELVIEPGVTLKFGPGAGITVRGILRAEGLPDNKIVFTSAGTETERQENRTVRLVDGPTVQEGIVQVKLSEQNIISPPGTPSSHLGQSV